MIALSSYFKALPYAACALAGALVVYLWHDAVVSRIERDAANKQAELSARIVEMSKKDEQDNSANTHLYLEQVYAASQEADELRRRLDSGAVTLRMCRADAAVARVQAANSSAAKDQAEADLAAYREDVVRLIRSGKELDAWVASAHEFINRQ